MSSKGNPQGETREPVNHDADGNSHHDSDDNAHDLKTDAESESKQSKVGVIIYLVLQLLALLLYVVGTPIGMFEVDNAWKVRLLGPDDNTQNLCVTAWGMRIGCNSAGYFTRDFTLVFCYRVRVNFRVTEAFCIMTIIFMILGALQGLLCLAKIVDRSFVCTVSVICACFAAVPWGIVAGMYHQQPCCETANWHTPEMVTTCTGDNLFFTEDVPPFKEMGKFGAGFGLLVASWTLQVISIVFTLVPL